MTSLDNDCTGFRAQAALYAQFKSRFSPMVTGMRVTVDADSDPARKKVL